MIALESLIALAALLFLKHLFADGPLQSNWQVANKGVWMHPAGWIHTGIHSGLTLVCFGVWAVLFEPKVDPTLLIAIACVECVVHYMIDYGKCSVDAANEWSSRVVDEQGRTVLQINDHSFFYAFIADQTLHSFTYVLMLYAVARF